MKKYLLALIISASGFASKAQYNFYKISAGAGLGVTRYYGDLTNPSFQPAANINLDYNFTPFTAVGVEVQKGFISASDDWGRAFKNSYLAVNVNGKMTLGQVVDFEASDFLYRIRNLYLGIGVGYIKNKHTERVNEVTYANGYRNVFAGAKDESAVVVPINFGYRFDIQDRFGFNRYSIVLNYQFNTSLNDKLDSYFNDPASHKNKFNDFYSIITIGAKVSFGPEGLY